MALLQSRPSLGSVAGVLTMVIGVAVAMFVLTQFQFGRNLVGASQKGTVATA